MRAIVGVTVQDPALPSPAEQVEPVAPGRPITSITPLTIVCPAQVVTGTPFDCTLTIVTPDPPPAAGAALRVTVPPGLFHLANSANARFDTDSRQLVLSLDRAPLATSTLSLSLMADEAGAGRTRTLSASVPIGEPRSTASAAAGESRVRADAEMDPVEAVTPVEALEKPREPARFDASATIVVGPGEPVIVSALESPATPLTATLLVVAAIVAALWTIRARRRTLRLAAMRTAGEPYVSSASSSSKEAIGASAIGAIVSVLLLFVCMPACIETVRARTIFVETTCTIVDRGSAGFAPEITYVPMAVVRYEAAGRTRVASGFDVRGTMYGSNDPDASRLFAAGGRYPCWYDPAQPQRVILRQGPSATAWFALLPVALLMLTLSVLLGAWRD
jgi:hypothetical protein